MTAITPQAARPNRAQGLPKRPPRYEAFGHHGPYIRAAQTLGELPFEKRKAALATAKARLGVEIQFGTTVGLANGLTPREIRQDARTWLALKGCDLPLSLFWSTKASDKTNHTTREV